MGRQRAVRRKTADRDSNRIAMFAITVVVICMALVVNVKVASLKEKAAAYQAREEALSQQVAKEEDRAADLEQYRIYVQTKEYIEKTAKEKLGLVNPDEILLKPEQQ